jgi:hypothetical protein
VTPFARVSHGIPLLVNVPPPPPLYSSVVSETNEGPMLLGYRNVNTDSTAWTRWKVCDTQLCIPSIASLCLTHNFDVHQPYSWQVIYFPFCIYQTLSIKRYISGNSFARFFGVCCKNGYVVNVDKPVYFVKNFNIINCCMWCIRTMKERVQS